jgi:hypothetical protein
LLLVRAPRSRTIEGTGLGRELPERLIPIPLDSFTYLLYAEFVSALHKSWR